MVDVGQRIKQRRQALGLSAEQLAARIGVSPATIYRYENNDIAHMRVDKLTPIANVLMTTPGDLMGWDDAPSNTRPVDSLVTLPVYGSIRCGPGGLAYQNIEERVLAANIKHPDECFYLRVEGDSMEPRISKGDLALIRKQEDVESGELAAVVIDGEEGTLKKVIKRDGSIILQSFNPDYPPRVFSGPELNEIRIVGKLIRTEREW